MSWRASTLTDRERAVLTGVVMGKTSRVIARVMGVSTKTVETHRSRIMKKLDVANRAELIASTLTRARCKSCGNVAFSTGFAVPR